VVLHPVERDPRPGDGHDAVDDAEREPFLFQDRALLDVQLEIGAHGPRDARLGAEIPDALELVDQPQPVTVAGVVGVLERDLPGHDPRGDHRGLEARALLVGEHDHPDRVTGPSPLVVQGAQGLERAEHPELAIVLPAARHRIRVRAHEHRRPRFRPRPQAEDVAHLVHRDREARLLHPAHQEVAPAPVVVGQGHSVEAAPRGLADLAERLHALRQPGPIDPHRLPPHMPR
jgi:hypothetical protein